jgi:nitrate reductase NapAB chaperone NapD
MTLRRLDLDYIAPARRPRWAGYALLAVALTVAGTLVMQYRAVKLDLERFETASALLSSGRRAPKTVPKERLDEEVRNAEAVVKQLTLPWAGLIHTLEEAATKDVAILQLQPDAQQRLLRIAAESRDKEAMLEYLRRLAAAEGLVNVHLVNHEVKLDDPQRPVQFSVQAHFKAGP